MSFTTVFELVISVMTPLTVNTSGKAHYSVFNVLLVPRGCTMGSTLRGTEIHLETTGLWARELLWAGFCFCIGSRCDHRNLRQLCFKLEFF